MSIALLNSILLRVKTDPNLSAKGSPLTWDEEDTNFVIIRDALSELSNVDTSGFTPYNAGTTYSNVGPDYVSYNGNIYEYINAVAQSGITPGSDPLTWQIVSLGQFAHEQNKDQYLDLGGPFEVSAEDVYNKVNEVVNGDTILNGGNSFTANASIGTNDAFDLLFRTSNTNKGVLTSAFQWGFGTTTPYTDTFISNQLNASNTVAEWWKTSGGVSIAKLPASGMFTAYGGFSNDDILTIRMDGTNNRYYLGAFSGSGNTGIDVSAFGFYAAQNNTGNDVSCFGSSTAQDNTGSDLNAFGRGAGQSNSGDYINAFGKGACYLNVANYVNAFGYYAAQENDIANIFTVSEISQVFWNNVGNKGYTTLQEVFIQSAMSADGTNSSAAASVQSFSSALATGNAAGGDLKWYYSVPGASGTTRQSRGLAATMDGVTGEFQFEKAVNFGDKDVDGSWRQRVDGSDFVIEKRESGVWVEKQRFS